MSGGGLISHAVSWRNIEQRCGTCWTKKIAKPCFFRLISEVCHYGGANGFFLVIVNSVPDGTCLCVFGKGKRCNWERNELGRDR